MLSKGIYNAKIIVRNLWDLLKANFKHFETVYNLEPKHNKPHLHYSKLHDDMIKAEIFNTFELSFVLIE